MANLVIDIGNTLTKIAVFAQNDLLQAEQYQQANAEILLGLIGKFGIKKAIISSVRRESENWEQEIQRYTALTYFTVDMTAGIQNLYKSPRTLGPDRLAAVIAAYKTYPGQNSLVIDAGTAITYDYVDTEGKYFGGSISPGLNMRYKALNYYTGGLPLIVADNNFNQGYGTDT